MNPRKRALITGITGQDGFYLTRFLLARGYEVHGMVRRSSIMPRTRIDMLRQQCPMAAEQVTLHYGDMTDAGGVFRLVLELEPDEIYNLAAQSHVRVSFDKPQYTAAVNAAGALNALEAARLLNQRKPTRIYQASTSEMFGGMPHTAPQDENTPFHPRSPYACSKVAAYFHTINYRESYDLFACNGILFNHESPLRGEAFVTRKVTLSAARIKEGVQEYLSMGNLDAERDWGYADDYVAAMWAMLQHDVPDDYVIATGESHSVRELVEFVFDRFDLDWRQYVRHDPRYDRPAEVEVLRGNAAKARDVLGWKPKTSFEQLLDLMIAHDRQQARQERRVADLPAHDEDEQTAIVP